MFWKKVSREDYIKVFIDTLQYNLEKPVNEDYEEEDEDDEYCSGARKSEDMEEDPIEGKWELSSGKLGKNWKIRIK